VAELWDYAGWEGSKYQVVKAAPEERGSAHDGGIVLLLVLMLTLTTRLPRAAKRFRVPGYCDGCQRRGNFRQKLPGEGPIDKRTDHGTAPRCSCPTYLRDPSQPFVLSPFPL
jgi:hypothetical protein